MEFLNLWKDAALIMTDSGGLQEETTALGIPCLTLRENTERPVTIDEGSNVLVGTDPPASSKAGKVLAGQGKTRPSPGPVGRQGRRAHRGRTGSFAAGLNPAVPMKRPLLRQMCRFGFFARQDGGIRSA